MYTNLALGVRILYLELSFMNFTNFLAEFYLADLVLILLLPPSILLTVLSSLMGITSLIEGSTLIVFSMKISKAATQLKLWMKR